MKAAFIAFACAVSLGVLGCANEGPTGEELQDQFGRGLRGEGRVTADIDRSNDPYVKPRGGRDLPPEG